MKKFTMGVLRTLCTAAGAVSLAAVMAMTMNGSAAAASACISQATSDAMSVCPAGRRTTSGGKRTQQQILKSVPAVIQKKNTASSKPVDPTSHNPPPRDDRKSRTDARSRPLLVVEVQQVEALLSTTPRNAPDRPKLIRRLAEDYVELESAAFRDKIQAGIDADSAQRRKDAARAAALRVEAAKAGKIVVAARHAAIKYYTLLKNQYPKHCESTRTGDPSRSSGCIDEVLYYLAYEYEQAGQLDQARKVYLELIQGWPQSRYIPNAYLAFGELFFNEAQGDPSKWAPAEQAYATVVKYPPPDNKVWGYAHYKLGYVAWNLGDFPRAMSEFKKTIEYGVRFPAISNAVHLAAAARKDIVPIYALAGDPKKAHDFFRPLSGDGAAESATTYQMLDDLGHAYLDTGHYKEGIALYQDLMNRDRGPKWCQYQGYITEATLAMKSGNKDLIKTALDRMLEARNQFTRGQYPEGAKRECSNTAAGILSETAMAMHLEAVGSGDVRGTGDKKTMAVAANIYQDVVGHFTKEEFAKFTFPRIVKEDWPSLFKIKYAMADLLYYNKDWAKCGPAFDAVVAEDPTGPLAAEAAYAAVLCYQNAYLAAHKDGSDRPDARTLACTTADASCAKARDKARFLPKALTEPQNRMIAAFNRYSCYVQPRPDDKEAQQRHADIGYALGYTYFEARHWEEAAAAFRKVALAHAGKDTGMHAVQLYLESLNVLAIHADPPRKSCYDTMGADVPKFIDLYCKGGGEKENADGCTILHAVQRDLQRTTIENEIQIAQQGGRGALERYEHAANAYMDLWKQYGDMACEKKEPSCKRMDEVLYNASKAFQAARLLAKSIAVKSILLSPRYGLDSTELGRKAVYEIGANYQAIAVYDEAASFYERFARENPTMDKAPEALQDAIVLRLGLGQQDQAIGDAALFEKSYGAKKSAQSAQIAFAVGAHYASKEDWDNAKKTIGAAVGRIDRYATPDVQIQAHALLGRVFAHNNSPSRAAAEYGKVRNAFRDPAAVFKKLDALGGEPDTTLRRRGKVLEAVGEALFFFAEQKRKDVDKIRFPEYKGSGSREDVLRHIRTRVKDWIEKKRPAIKHAEQEYLAILKLEPAPPRWVIAAGARVGQMWGSFVREFRAAPIPKEWKGDGFVPGTNLSYAELRGTYWGELDKASEPQKQQAKAAFETCLGYSVKYMYFDDNSRSCEKWLSSNYGAQYHLIDEFRGAPVRVNSTLDDHAIPVTLDGTALKLGALSAATPGHRR